MAEHDFHSVYEKHSGMVRRMLYRLCDPNDLDDLVQITFIKVFETLDQVRNEAALKSWIGKIAINTARDKMREKGRKNWLQFWRPEEIPEARSSAAGALESLQGNENIDRWLKTLSPKLRETIVLFSLEELEVKEIALILEIPEGTVKSRLSQAREQLRPLIENEDNTLRSKK